MSLASILSGQTTLDQDASVVVPGVLSEQPRLSTIGTRIQKQNTLSERYVFM